MVSGLRRVMAVALLYLLVGAAHAEVHYVGTYSSVTAVGRTLVEACSALVGAIDRAKLLSFPVTFKSAALGQYGCRFDIQRPAEQGGVISDAGDIAEAQGPCPSCGGGGPEACVGTMGKDKTFVRNWTVGYSRSPDESDEKFVGPVNRLPGAGNPVCMGGCKVLQQDTSAPGWKAWISQSPTDQGLFRNSLDVPFTSTGETCTEGTGATAPISPDVPAPPCPGYVGEVNGKPGCYGTSSKPIDPVSKSLPPVPKDAGNPPAGSGPESPNTGQSRTPAAGSGGPSGGPAGAAVGGKGGKEGGTPSLGGTGTTPKPGDGEEQAACGAPGQPPCAIDGSDVPKDAGSAVDAAKTASEKNAADTKAAIERAASMEAPGWSFSFQLPTGCTPYTPAAFGDFGISINPCEWQGTIHDLMSMIWAAVTAFCIIGMVGRAIREA